MVSLGVGVTPLASLPASAVYDPPKIMAASPITLVKMLHNSVKINMSRLCSVETFLTFLPVFAAET